LLELWRQERLSPGIHRQSAEVIDLDSYPGFSPLIDYLPPIEISRGCNFGCMYCAVPGLCRGKVLNRSISAIIGILEEYYRLKNRRKRIKFLSSNAFGYMAGGRQPDPAALQALLKSVKDFGVAEIQFGTFPGEVRPDFVNREVMEIVSKYTANKLIVMGVQTGSNAMLQKMNRGHSLEQAIDAIALLHDFGYLPLIDLIIGNPGETYQERLDLLEFIQDMIKHYRIRVHLHAFMPLPGTPWQHRFQEPIEPDIHKRLKKLANAGHLEGWWENQIGIGRQHRLQAKHFC
jgi:B12-binding domain/radical SAM domain protein